MAITDLTNTTWEIPAGWTASWGFGVFGATYGTINGIEFGSINIGYYVDEDLVPLKEVNQIAYYDSSIGILKSISNSTALTITFTGGTEVTNPDLISWLEANGTLQGGSEPVTIKAGTYTWNETIPQSGWCSGTTVKSVGFSFKIKLGSSTYSKYGFYYTNIDEETYTTSWHLSDTDWLVNRLMGYGFQYNSWSNGDIRTFTVETDQEVTGDDPQGFMDYLTANSDYGSQSEPEQVPKLYIGNKAVTSMSIGNKAILKMYVGNSLIYEKASGENLISFTVGSTTYQAEDGMTWAEWCDSEYNLGGFYVSEGTGGWVVLSSTSWVVPPNGNYGDHVYGTNVIISGGAYTLEYD